VVLLQEVDDGAARTDGNNQVDQLLSRLGDAYPCHASAFYWKAGFVPHGRVMGSVGLKVTTLSRTRIDSAIRHQLALIPADPVSTQFGLKRAVLEARLPVEGGKDLVVLNTHLDAFAQGTDTMQRQVAQVGALLERLSDEGHPWLIGGDFNLLPSARAYDRLGEAQQAYYSMPTELGSFFERFQAVPSLQECDGPDSASWFTHFPNDPAVGKPDRTIDYVFASSDLTLGPHRVRQADTLGISDHLPVLLSLTVP
jgi:endonuclease/exonuclease/phosphatase family metal-dependent hydrolase